MPARRTDPAELVERAAKGEPRAVARLISLVENDAPQLRAVMAALAGRGGRARVVGLTGAPGVGKSTTTSALVAGLRARGRRVGVLAVDPSSPFTGGALLGDRVRMQDHATDPGVFIRSMASRGRLGGLSWAAPHALRVLDAAGCEVILVETVGVGQAEVEIAGHADTTLVLAAPGMGDSVQAAKAGVLEIADILVVNKADREGAQATVRDLRTMVGLAPSEPGGWKPPVVAVSAARAEGVDELLRQLDQHERWLEESGELRRRRRARARAEVEAIALEALRARIGSVRDHRLLDELAERVAGGGTDPYAAADELVAAVAGDVPAPLSR
ncbi:methylmalonyl Co-A mutase-associated GTPase MeaB [Allonocardiopsis opalescens]|uniref:LAO/AO transport system kinase n=1 Tax=Allonocardiopsis opalescens TaxID=1144618 RepID=A0A2T0QD65_9ACTN|nr:methylmalonyl Co-A mutase-associated GTPase MeaB [Allonocardiopsis opalescens]PRY01810.1 LAO/AO transport system kinase [Allonocardiopsis opalescens]